MNADDRKLVDIFMKAQAEPEGRVFSENVLAGIKAVLLSVSPEEALQGTWAKEDPRRAFVEGAKWCFFYKYQTTLFAHEVDDAEAEATKRYPPQR